MTFERREDIEHTHPATLDIGIGRPGPTEPYRVLVLLRPLTAVPVGHRVGVDYSVADMVDLVNALTVATMQANERNGGDLLNAITTGDGSGL